jgi:hypothetical protein
MYIVILFSRNCRLSLTACPLALLAILKIRISNIVVVYIDAVHLYIFKIFLQEERSPANEYYDRNGTVVNDYPIDLFHITLIYGTE